MADIYDNNDIITTDKPLTAKQIEILAGLLDVIIPASEDRSMPSASELDLIAYLLEHAPELIEDLIEGLKTLDDTHFTSQSQPDRQSLVEEYSKDQPELFGTLLFHIYACYYQDDNVLKGLGLAPGPPFPGGNTVISGDLSLLDPVLKRPRLYRT